jgi:hypothetical protein
MALSCRYRSVTLPSIANGGITAAGLIGEGKLEYFAQVDGLSRRYLARTVAVDTDPMPSASSLRSTLNGAGLAFPLIVKPDVGLCGHGVRYVGDMQALLQYSHQFPKHETFLVQEYLPQDHEAGIFYYRYPGQDNGQLLGVALRYFPRVTGDGRHTVQQLIDANPRLARLQDVGHQCTSDREMVPKAGEQVRLATIGSTRVGGLYRDGKSLITARLTAVIDQIARDMPDFYFGRFDVRFANTAELMQGAGFKIMEINGAGSEAIQAWDPDTTLIAGFRTVFAKQRILFSIGAARRRLGESPIGIAGLASLFRRQQRLLSLYPPSN